MLLAKEPCRCWITIWAAIITGCRNPDWCWKKANGPPTYSFRVCFSVILPMAGNLIPKAQYIKIRYRLPGKLYNAELLIPEEEEEPLRENEFILKDPIIPMLPAKNGVR